MRARITTNPSNAHTLPHSHPPTPNPTAFAAITRQQAPNPYLTGIPTNTYNPYFSPAGHLVPTALLGPDPAAVQSSLGHGVVPQAVNVSQQKIPRSDRLEVSLFCLCFS